MYALSYMTHVQRHTQGLTARAPLIEALGRALGVVDPYTAAHNARVGALSGLIAEALGLPLADVAHMREAGALHDIGKLGVPHAALCKPGALSVDEYEEVKRHPELGLRILERHPALLDLAPGVLYHHERVDGGGYPFGLKGAAIPLAARVVAAADTVDAMLSDRAYRRALGLARARAELVRAAGSQLDAEVVGATLEALGRAELALEEG